MVALGIGPDGMNRRTAAIPLILVLAFVGTGLMFVNSSGPTAFDLSVFESVSHLRSQALTDAAVFITQLGRTPVALLFSFVAWCRSRTMAKHMATATLVGEAILQIVKLVIARPRPEGILALVSASGYSFPSGHSLVAAATYTTAAILICRELQRPLQRILVVAAASLIIVLVAASRVYLGVHYASDAIGGIFLGTAWATILAQRWYHGRKDS
jgi:undecaprenyl-diphosphatase